VGDKEIPFNKEATHWLGVLSEPRAHPEGATRLKKGRNAMNRLTGQMSLSPVDCRKVTTACVQSAAMFRRGTLVER
jgi:hypothetical protein